MYKEADNIVLNQAIYTFEKETGIQLSVINQRQEAKGDRRKLRVDAVLGVAGYEPLQFAAEVKKWAQHANFGAIIERFKRLPMKGLLVADYINPEMARRLKKAEIQFIDTAGNAYINAEPLFIFIIGNRHKNNGISKKEARKRAFTQTGLKLVYAFLCEPELVSKTYREIAKNADVALGTVDRVIVDLKEMHFLVEPGGKKSRKLNNYFELLAKWVEMYPAVLRPKLFIGEFYKDDTTDMKKIHLEDYDACWGGEVAGTYYTDYLRREIDLIYVPANKEKALIHDLKLSVGGENKFGITKLYRPFWRKPEVYERYVHPILAYADLIATGDAKNLTTAKEIMTKRIRPKWQA